MFSKDVYSKDVYSKDTYSKDVYSKDLYGKDVYSKAIYSKDVKLCTLRTCTVRLCTERMCSCTVRRLQEGLVKVAAVPPAEAVPSTSGPVRLTLRSQMPSRWPAYSFSSWQTAREVVVLKLDTICHRRK